MGTTTPGSELKLRITEDMQAAMRARDRQRLGAIRLILAGIKQREVDTRTELSNEDIMAILDKMAKQRGESIGQYEKAGREDLVSQERFELELIRSYLPEALSEDDLDRLVDAAIAGTLAGSMQDMGKVMGVLKPQLVGRADMGEVSKKVKGRLSG